MWLIVVIGGCMSLCVRFMLLTAYLMFFFKQKTAYESRISDWRSDVCSSDLQAGAEHVAAHQRQRHRILARRRDDRIETARRHELVRGQRHRMLVDRKSGV